MQLLGQATVALISRMLTVVAQRHVHASHRVKAAQRCTIVWRAISCFRVVAFALYAHLPMLNDVLFAVRSRNGSTKCTKRVIAVNRSRHHMPLWVSNLLFLVSNSHAWLSERVGQSWMPLKFESGPRGQMTSLSSSTRQPHSRNTGTGGDIPVRRPIQIGFGMRLTLQRGIKRRSSHQVPPSHSCPSFLPFSSLLLFFAVCGFVAQVAFSDVAAQLGISGLLVWLSCR